MSLFMATFSVFVSWSCSVGSCRHSSSITSQEKVKCKPYRAPFKWTQMWRIYLFFCYGLIYYTLTSATTHIFYTASEEHPAPGEQERKICLWQVFPPQFLTFLFLTLINQKDSYSPHVVSFGACLPPPGSIFILLFNHVNLFLLNRALHIAQGQVVTRCDIIMLY